MDKSSNNVSYMTPSEAATLLMISPITLRHWALAGKLAFMTHRVDIDVLLKMK